MYGIVKTCYSKENEMFKSLNHFFKHSGRDWFGTWSGSNC